jgi:CDK inhibitor PHO81
LTLSNLPDPPIEMKFGKQLQSNQIPGWSAAYLDYKFLKKIINSLEKGRLGDAALFATGVRPEYIPEDANRIDADGNAQILPRVEGSDELQAHKAAFFFKLERELEKVSSRAGDGQ